MKKVCLILANIYISCKKKLANNPITNGTCQEHNINFVHKWSVDLCADHLCADGA